MKHIDIVQCSYRHEFKKALLCHKHMAIYASMVVTLTVKFYKNDGHTMQIYFFTVY